MNDEIVILIDSSGSFTECGKNFLQIYLVDTIRNAIEDGTLPPSVPFRYLLWNEDICEYQNPDDNLIPFQGQSDVNVLETFLIALPEQSVVFFLTDGNFSIDTEMLVSQLNARQIRLLPFAVGADANAGALELLSTEKQVYPAADMLSVIKKTLLEIVL